VAVADFAHDNYPDIVLTNFGDGYGSPTQPGTTPGSTITYVQRTSTGFNSSPITLSTGGTNPSFVVAADLNGDGYSDLVVTNENGQGAGSFSIFQNNGAGVLSLAGTYSTYSNNPAGVAVADVTGDGIPDVIVCSFGADGGGGGSVVGNNITIFQQNATAGHGNFTFQTSPITTLTGGGIQFIPTALVVTDLDGDGLPDIAATVPGVPPDSLSPQPTGSVYVFKGTGAGGFGTPNTYGSGGALPINIQAADVNGDGKKDLIVANAGDPNGNPEFINNAVGVITNASTTGNLSFGFTSSITTNCYGTFATAVADFDGDGHQDIAAVNYGTQNPFASAPVGFVSIYLGSATSPGSFNAASPGTYNTGTNEPGGQYVAVGDFDHNGTPDLVVANADPFGYGTKVGLMMNTSTPPATVTTVSSVQVNDGSAQRSEVRSLKVTFSGPVTFTGGNAAAAAAFQLKHVQTNDNIANLAAAVSTNGSGQTVVTLTFTTSGNLTTDVDPVSAANGGQASLQDGRYQLTILSSNVMGSGNQALDGDGNGTAGGNYVSPAETTYSATGLHLYRLFGDATGDGYVDLSDLAVFRGAYNNAVSSPNYVAYLDADNSGVIDLSDLTEFRNRYNHSVYT
jgi:hypothetical protein